jgi:hypothetical protein
MRSKILIASEEETVNWMIRYRRELLDDPF